MTPYTLPELDRDLLHDNPNTQDIVDYITKIAQAAYAAGLAEGRKVPEGWKLVPVQPTNVMLDCFSGTNFLGLSFGKQVSERKAYAAMLAAAPEPVCTACNGTKQVYGGEVCTFCDEPSHD